MQFRLQTLAIALPLAVGLMCVGGGYIASNPELRFAALKAAVFAPLIVPCLVYAVARASGASMTARESLVVVSALFSLAIFTAAALLFLLAHSV
jgi:hypothetical protein